MSYICRFLAGIVYSQAVRTGSAPAHFLLIAEEPFYLYAYTFCIYYKYRFSPIDF